MIDCLRSFYLVKSKANVCVAPGQLSTMYRYVIVKHVTSIGRSGTLRADHSGKTRVALHVPSPTLAGKC